jgi:Flp pilus assembly protein TadG
MTGGESGLGCWAKGGLMKWFRSVIKSETGSSLIEYAIVFVLLMTMLLGIADFSRALYAYHFVSSAAREATRYAAVRGQGCVTDTCWLYDGTAMGSRVLTKADLTSFVQNVPLGLQSGNVTLIPAPVWSDSANEAAGSTIQVTVKYKFNFLFPFVSKSTLNLASSSQMVIAH